MAVIELPFPVHRKPADAESLIGDYRPKYVIHQIPVNGSFSYKRGVPAKLDVPNSEAIFLCICILLKCRNAFSFLNLIDRAGFTILVSCASMLGQPQESPVSRFGAITLSRLPEVLWDVS